MDEPVGTDGSELPAMQPRRAWIVRGDVDGFFGLFIDNLLQLMLIYTLGSTVAGLSPEFLTHTVLPGAALSILVGNLFYAWQAHRLMRSTGRRDVTALPYGINTPSVIAYIVLIMGPVYRMHAGDGSDPARVLEAQRLAWQAGLFACFASGAMETAGAFVGAWLRRVTPRAALLSALAGVAITFIAMGFVFQLFAMPAVAVLPMLLIIFTYAGRLRLPGGLPGGLTAVVLGVALAWGFRTLGFAYWAGPSVEVAGGAALPRAVPADVFAVLATPYAWQFLAIIVPMGLFNVIGSLQNLESAEAAGDSYATKPALLANGLGTFVAAFFGSPFPTTIYIGHPGWKAMGARASYSAVNGVAIALICVTGGMAWVLHVVPLEATLGILLWIAVVMTAQAFVEVPREHALAVAIGLIPAFGAWVVVLLEGALRVAGMSLPDAADGLAASGTFLAGAVALSQGFLVTSMLLAAIVAHVTDRRLGVAAAWTAVAAVLAALGVIHGFELTPAGVEPRLLDFQFGPDATNPALEFALAYALAAALLWGLAWRERRVGAAAEQERP